MTYVPAKQGALFIPSGPVGDHLFVIVTGASIPASHGTHLIVNFSSIKPGIPHDASCLVAPGEHVFITRPSYIEYEFARIEMARDLAHGVDTGTFRKHPDPISHALLAKIRAGLRVSPRAPRKCGTYLSRYENNA